MPTDTEWVTLIEALKLQPELYSSQTTASDSDAGNVMRSIAAGSGAFGGTSKASDSGGFDGLLAGFANEFVGIRGYGDKGNWWTSSSFSVSPGFNIGNSWAIKVSGNDSLIENTGVARDNELSVRCKKD